jgi:hypothetical protein
VRIGNLVEHQHDAGGGQIGKRRRGQGIGLGEQALMYGVRRQPGSNGVGPHQFRLDWQRDAVIGQAPCGVLRRQYFPNVPRRIGERGRHGVLAIKDDAVVAAAMRPAKPGVRRPPAPVRSPVEGVLSRVLHCRRSIRTGTGHIAPHP